MRRYLYDTCYMLGHHKALKTPRQRLVIPSNVIELGLLYFKNFAHFGLHLKTLISKTLPQHTVMMLSCWKQTSRVKISKS